MRQSYSYGRFVRFALAMCAATIIGVGSSAGASGNGPSHTGSAPAACRPVTEGQKIATARAWHEEVINRRNPAFLGKILTPNVVHHAAGGYPSMMNAAGVKAMMDDFLRAFPDLRITFNQFIVQGSYVVERYTATGTQLGQLGQLPAAKRRATWTGINIFRMQCGRIAEIWSEVDAIGRNRQLAGSNSAQ